jgi:hypothetical protein
MRQADSSDVARTLLEAFATGSGRLADELLACLADGERYRYWRLQATVGPCSFAFDDTRPENVACLHERARELVAENDEVLTAIAQALVAAHR